MLENLSEQASGFFKNLGLNVEQLKEIAKTVFEQGNPQSLSFTMKGQVESEHERQPIYPSPLGRMGGVQVEEDVDNVEILTFVHDENYTFSRKEDGNIELHIKKNNRTIRTAEGEPKEYKNTMDITSTITIVRGAKPKIAEQITD